MKMLAKVLTLVMVTGATSASWVSATENPDVTGEQQSKISQEDGERHEQHKRKSGDKDKHGNRSDHKKRKRDYGQDLAVARQVIAKSGITAEKAIYIAKKLKTGVVYSYDLQSRPNRLLYEIDLVDVAKKERYQVGIDASTGEIISESINRGLNERRMTQAAEVISVIQKSGFSIKDAIALVNPRNELLVTEASVRSRHGIHFIEVEAVSEQGKRKVLVDIDKKSIIPGLKRNPNGS